MDTEKIEEIAENVESTICKAKTGVKRTKLILTVVLITIGVVAVGGVIADLTNLLDLGLFKRKPLLIDKTANVITEIKKISEFTSACFFEELVIQDAKYNIKEKPVYKKEESNEKGISRLVSIVKKEDKVQDGVVLDSTMTAQIVAITQAKVRAGFDLSKMEEHDLRINGDTLFVNVPEAQVFDVILNPSDYELFYHKGTWEDDEVNKVLTRARDIILNDAKEFGLLEKATESGKKKLEDLFKTFGFKEVVVK